jgi:hypothetical protein
MGVEVVNSTREISEPPHVGAKSRCVKYGPRALAREAGQSARTIRRFLSEKYPGHEGWWIFSERQFHELIQELKTRNPDRRHGGLRFRKKSLET